MLDSLIALGKPSLALRLRRGDASAFEQAIASIADSKVSAADRIQLLQIVGQVPTSDEAVAERLTAALLKVISEDKLQSIKSAAVAALAKAKGDVAQPLLDRWNEFGAETRTAVGALLASRPVLDVGLDSCG